MSAMNWGSLSFKAKFSSNWGRVAIPAYDGNQIPGGMITQTDRR
jgi:hypothetical protein